MSKFNDFIIELSCALYESSILRICFVLVPLILIYTYDLSSVFSYVIGAFVGAFVSSLVSFWCFVVLSESGEETDEG